MITVTELLAAKRQKTPISVRSKATVFDALKLMSEKQVSALAVVDEPGKLTGVFTEWDCAHRITLCGRVAKETVVAEVMTPAEQVYFVQPSNSIDECMVLMTAKQITSTLRRARTRASWIAQLVNCSRRPICSRATSTRRG